jgi:hypothetical protein
MARLPKGFRNDININLGKIGPARRQEILDGIANKGTFLPRGVSEEDMDETFNDFIDKKLSITIDGQKVPVLFLTIQRWSEYTKTWKFTDKYKDIQMPFITIVRRPDIQVGQNQAGLWNIPNGRTYTYYKVPTWDGIRKGMDLYKVPQPTPVDITYDVRMFTNRTRDLNKFNTKVHIEAQSRQMYINVKGHPMPVYLEAISDESNIDDFENRRFYVQKFEMRLAGYLLDEEDFEVVPTINRTLTFIEFVEDNTMRNLIFEPIIDGGGIATYTIIFKPSSEPQFSFISKYDVNFTQLVDVESISRIIIMINGVGVFDGVTLYAPIRINVGDTVNIQVFKPNAATSKFQLIGNKI